MKVGDRVKNVLCSNPTCSGCGSTHTGTIIRIKNDMYVVKYDAGSEFDEYHTSIKLINNYKERLLEFQDR